MLLGEEDLDRRSEVVARAADALRELGDGEGALGVLARVEGRDRDAVVRRALAFENLDDVAAQPRQPARDLDVLARPAREELLARELRQLPHQADPPDHDPAARRAAAY